MRVSDFTAQLFAPYGIKLRIVRTIVVVRPFDGCDCVSPGDGGGGDTTPGEVICPEKAEAVSSKHRIVAAHVWRKVFMFICLLSEIENFA